MFLFMYLFIYLFIYLFMYYLTLILNILAACQCPTNWLQHQSMRIYSYQ